MFLSEASIARELDDMTSATVGDATLVIIRVGAAPNETLLRAAVASPDHYAAVETYADVKNLRGILQRAVCPNRMPPIASEL